MLNDIGINEKFANDLFTDLELNKVELENMIKSNINDKHIDSNVVVQPIQINLNKDLINEFEKIKKKEEITQQDKTVVDTSNKNNNNLNNNITNTNNVVNLNNVSNVNNIQSFQTQVVEQQTGLINNNSKFSCCSYNKYESIKTYRIKKSFRCC